LRHTFRTTYHPVFQNDNIHISCFTYHRCFPLARLDPAPSCRFRLAVLTSVVKAWELHIGAAATAAGRVRAFVGLLPCGVFFGCHFVMPSTCRTTERKSLPAADTLLPPFDKVTICHVSPCRKSPSCRTVLSQPASSSCNNIFIAFSLSVILPLGSVWLYLYFRNVGRDARRCNR
jgi:hypothetical protein